MDCVCGCGRDIPKKMIERNFAAAGVALELLAWDKNRVSPTPGPEGREGLIARGADCYQRLLYSLHGEGGGDPDADCDEWLRESSDMRLQRSDMTKKRFLGRGGGSPNLSEFDMAQLDRLHPELSFTGKAAAPGDGQAAASAEAAREPVARPNGAAPEDDLVDKLERLRTMRDDGVLTDEEFAAAKTRLLG